MLVAILAVLVLILFVLLALYGAVTGEINRRAAMREYRSRGGTID